jgi:hypothetical protein
MDIWPSWASPAKDVLLALIALYGAVLSTINWRQASRKERRVMKVEVAYATPFVGTQFLDDHIRVIATNVGHRKVTVTMLGLEVNSRRLVTLPGRQIMDLGDTALPATLDDGERAIVHYVRRDVGQRLLNDRPGKHKLVPYCEDTTGTVYRGKGFSVDAEHYSSSH